MIQRLEHSYILPAFGWNRLTQLQAIDVLNYIHRFSTFEKLFMIVCHHRVQKTGKACNPICILNQFIYYYVTLSCCCWHLYAFLNSMFKIISHIQGMCTHDYAFMCQQQCHAEVHVERLIIIYYTMISCDSYSFPKSNKIIFTTFGTSIKQTLRLISLT